MPLIGAESYDPSEVRYEPDENAAARALYNEFIESQIDKYFDKLQVVLSDYIKKEEFNELFGDVRKSIMEKVEKENG